MKKLFASAFLIAIISISNAYAYCNTKSCAVRFSDIKLKENPVQIDNALEKLSQLRGVSFVWNKNNKKDIGVIAQDVEKLFPELVQNSIINSEDGKIKTLKTVNYAGLIGLLIEAVKELKKENQILSDQLRL
ncbi:tail fiber domain-containing protein [Spartinivicinus poritis]|uniref:Tail fiber domain-containing protein n=1 Tax=Spartinivicinus poritis TaxID=2994640 RepID=A0ABT5UC81_9GAMM|nr:tail fiber domain-containing protein [Spartinivicinus sp. A2-2]MDE1463983.1 tail fiber domain-containing protein [Spartinivicinus sp. A2-2]